MQRGKITSFDWFIVRAKSIHGTVRPNNRPHAIISPQKMSRYTHTHVRTRKGKIILSLSEINNIEMRAKRAQNLD